jgi:hypothetical protein
VSGSSGRLNTLDEAPAKSRAARNKKDFNFIVKKAAFFTKIEKNGILHTLLCYVWTSVTNSANLSATEIRVCLPSPDGFPTKAVSNTWPEVFLF